MQVNPCDDPLGSDGFEFIECAAPDAAATGALFERTGFTAVAGMLGVRPAPQGPAR